MAGNPLDVMIVTDLPKCCRNKLDDMKARAESARDTKFLIAIASKLVALRGSPADKLVGQIDSLFAKSMPDTGDSITSIKMETVIKIATIHSTLDHPSGVEGIPYRELSPRDQAAVDRFWATLINALEKA